MEAIDGLIYGLQIALSPSNILAALIGCVAGTLVGVLPGLGPLAGTAILLPITFAMDPVAGLIMLAAVYYGVMYGGSTSAILLNIPGDAPAVVSAIEGYEMTKQGRAGPALGVTALASFFGGTGAVVLVVFLSPVLARTALMFGAAEFFAMTAGGLLLLSRLLGGSLTSGLLPMIVGVALGTVGMDSGGGTFRYTFGVLEIAQGIDVAAVAIGLFGVAQLVVMVSAVNNRPVVRSLRFMDLVPTRSDMRRAIPAFARGAPIGFVLGLLPGAASVVSTFLSYRLEKSISKRRSEFGKGAIEGLAGPEAANNAAATAAMVPALSLGIPFSPVVALMLAALIVQGITPGPLIMTQHPDLFWGVIASMVVANVLLLIVNFPFIRVWVAMLRIPSYVFIPIVLVVSVFGAYAARNSMVDVYVAFGLGVLGYIFVLAKFQPAPLLVGLVLGPLAEKHFREGLLVSGGDVSYFWTQSVAATIWVLLALALAIPAVTRVIRARPSAVPTENNAPERASAHVPQLSNHSTEIDALDKAK